MRAGRRQRTGRSSCWVVDARVETNPVPIATFPPPPLRRRSRKRGGRFGAHNLHENLPVPTSWHSETIVIGTFFNAGVRAYDVIEPVPAAGGRLLRPRRAEALAGRRDPAERRVRRRPRHRVHGRPVRRRAVRPGDDDLSRRPRTAIPWPAGCRSRVITGFLGSGKTTLIRRLLAPSGHEPRGGDRQRVRRGRHRPRRWSRPRPRTSPCSRTAASAAPCAPTCRRRCATLFAQRRAGEVIDFDRVVVETTGLADPAPVIQTLATDTMLAAHYRLDGVVTLVDAVNGPGQLDREAEAVKQAALADRLLITKTDLADASGVARAAARAQPARRRRRSRSRARSIPRSSPASVWQARAPTRRRSGAGSARGRARAPTSAPSHRATIAASRRSRSGSTAPFGWQAFTAAMELLTSLRGPDLLRVKGLVNVEGEPGPVVVQGVQHVFHPPVTLAAWPSDDRRSRLVFITAGDRRAGGVGGVRRSRDAAALTARGQAGR